MDSAISVNSFISDIEKQTSCLKLHLDPFRHLFESREPTSSFSRDQEFEMELKMIVDFCEKAKLTTAVIQNEHRKHLRLDSSTFILSVFMASANNLGAFVTGSEKEKEFPPQKRRKITKELGSNLQPTQLNVVPVPATTLGDGDTNTELPLQILPPDLYHLQSKYEFTSMSIISSSKIELKVRSLQRRLEKFSFADTKAKPQVVALHAKAPVVSKMVTIVQIVKRNIEKEKSKWWQYSKLHGQIIELDETPKKGRERGKMLREWESNRAAASGPDPAASTLDGTAVEADGEDDQAFEMMDTNDQQAEARKRIRAVPIMTIYMSMVPVKELREAYSEQTNAPTKV